jgi:NADPH2:quinone reductase
MRAILFDRFGGTDALRLVEVPAPVGSPDTAIVAVKAASINPSDVKNLQGRMTQTTLPRIPGRDYSGIVVAGPERWIGAEVWGSGGDSGFTRDGSHAELLAVPTASLRRKPKRLSHEEAASVGVNFLAALGGLQAAGLAPGETLALIGLGGVGGAAAQIAKRQGAQIIAIVRDPPPPEAPGLPALDALITAADGDPVARLRALTDHGAQVVFDTVGGSMFERALPMLAPRGRLVEISATDRRQVSFDLADFYHNESRLFGIDTLKLDQTASADLLDELAAGFEDGHYRPPFIAARFGLDQAQEAYRQVERGSTGRVVLLPG